MAAKIADLRHRITFQSLVRTPDGQGGFTESWVNFASVWAKIEPSSARERYFSQQIQPTITHKLTIRWLEGLKTEMRISYLDRIFQIHGIRREDERRFFMMIDAEEGVGS